MQRYQRKVLSLLDVMGSTIVDIFYNHMYDAAIIMKERTEHNITDCYKRTIDQYVSTRDTSEFYKRIMNTVLHYTRISTVYSDISFADGIDLYSSLFIPEVYIRSLTEKQKHDVLSMVLRDSIKNFSDKLLSDYLAVIIDEHQDPTNIALLQDSILTELVANRDISYERFMNANKGSSKDKPKKKAVSIKNNNNAANIKMQKSLMKLGKLYKKTVEDKCKLKDKYVALFNKYNALADQTKQLQDMFMKQIESLKQSRESNRPLTAEPVELPIAPAPNNTPESPKPKWTDPEEDLFDLVSVSYQD